MQKASQIQNSGILGLSVLLLIIILIPTLYYFPFWERKNPQEPFVEQATLGSERLFLKVHVSASVQILATVFPTCEVVETQQGIRVSGSSILRHLEEHGIASSALWDELRREDPSLSISEDLCQIVFSMHREERKTRYILLPVALAAIAISLTSQ